jgi:hypothetical protein
LAAAYSDAATGLASEVVQGSAEVLEAVLELVAVEGLVVVSAMVVGLEQVLG